MELMGAFVEWYTSSGTPAICPEPETMFKYAGNMMEVREMLKFGCSLLLGLGANAGVWDFPRA
jgi:hypothetical protein